MYDIDQETYDCPVEALSNILGKKWVAIILWQLQNNKMRFGELQRAVDGCTKKMLMQQLDLLISKQIVMNEKTVKNNALESIYYLSDSGLGLLPILKSMMIWSDKNLSCH